MVETDFNAGPVSVREIETLVVVAVEGVEKLRWTQE